MQAMKNSKAGNIPLAAAILLAVLCYSPLKAAEKTAGVIGTGGFSCGQFIAYDRQNNAAQMNLIAQWSWGFMSAYNARAVFSATYSKTVAPRQIAPPDEPTVLLFIKRHCETYPLSNVITATIYLIENLGGIASGSITLPGVSTHD
jgi:hypothetical protein